MPMPPPAGETLGALAVRRHLRPLLEAADHFRRDGLGGGGDDVVDDALGDLAFLAGGDGLEEGDGGAAVADVFDVGAGVAVEARGEVAEVDVGGDGAMGE